MPATGSFFEGTVLKNQQDVSDGAMMQEFTASLPMAVYETKHRIDLTDRVERGGCALIVYQSISPALAVAGENLLH